MNRGANETPYAEALEDDLEESNPAFGGPPGRSDFVVGAVVLGAAGAAAAVAATGGVSTESTALALILSANILTFALAGLLWRHGRPSSSFGTLLYAVGLLLVPAALGGSAVPGLHLAGILAGWAWAIGITWLLVAFPRALPRGAAWIVLSVGFVTFVFGELPLILTARTVHTLLVVGRCTDACPANPAHVVDAPAVAQAFGHVEHVLQVLWGVAALVYLVLHYLRASRPRRRMLLPLYVTGIPFVTAFAINAFVSDLGGVHLSFEARAVYIGIRVVAPLGFIAALLFARSYAAGAVWFMTARLVGQPSVATVEQLVRRALDDPQARLAFWLPDGQTFVDRHGNAVTLDARAEGLSWHSFGREGKPALAIVHDGALGDDLELVEAVGDASMLALDNRQLHQELLDSVRDLRASQQRLVRASSAERRKLERDLHDGLQQKLVALRIHLELARDLAEEETSLGPRLAALGSGFDEALEELRTVAHGIYPPLLAEEGLSAALREAARRSAVPVTVDVADVGRLSEDCETAIYYCCLEGLQNVAKHAGKDALAAIRLWREPQVVHFSIVDDGVGFASRRGRRDVGLTNMVDRIGAVGGSLDIRSAPGEGTTVEGRVAVEAGDWTTDNLLTA